MSERTQFIGQRVELRQKRQLLAVDIEAQRDRLRGLLNPLTEVSQLDGDGIMNQTIVLAQRLDELKALDATLSKIAEILGD